eukprot:1869529-Prymnesium_polylepis.1
MVLSPRHDSGRNESGDPIMCPVRLPRTLEYTQPCTNIALACARAARLPRAHTLKAPPPARPPSKVTCCQSPGHPTAGCSS